MSPETCSNCGADVPRKAKACPECGADETSGWSKTAYTSSLGLPEENFDYDEFVNKEFGSGQMRPRGIHWLWWATALILILLFLLFCLH